MKVHLTYFKQNGKYYSDGEYETQKGHLFEIFEEVHKMLIARTCPGLIAGHSDFIVLVDVPKHPFNHPHLVIDKEI